MIAKLRILSRLIETGLVAVVRAETADQAVRIAEAVVAGGCPAIEITFTVPAALRVIESLAARFQPSELLLGAGTVLDPETARIAILSGANFIVSPHLNESTVRLCNRYQVPVMPGAMTIKDVVAAMESGADIIKVFPGEAFGPAIIRSIKGPLPQAPLMPTGGVDLDNVSEWIKAGSAAVGVGGSLTAGAKTGDYLSITRMTAEFIKRIQEARSL